MSTFTSTTRLLTLTLLFAIVSCLSGCGGSDTTGNSPTQEEGNNTRNAANEPAEDHAHDEVSIGTVTIEGMEIALAQGHGAVAPGKEGHLIVKLPYTDNGATIVRAWIGTEDRTLSLVGKGEYAPSHDDYDIHATAPDLLTPEMMWWIEIEKPDGTRAIGSAKPIVE